MTRRQSHRSMKDAESGRRNVRNRFQTIAGLAGVALLVGDLSATLPDSAWQRLIKLYGDPADFVSILEDESTAIVVDQTKAPLRG